MKNYIIQISNPCLESWDAMQATNDGRFCDVCKKNVVDFTQFSDAEIVQYLSKLPNQPICGQFNNAQLNRKLQLIEHQEIRRNSATWKIALASLTLGSWLAIGTASTHARQLPQIPPKEWMQLIDNQEDKTIKLANNYSGLVLDASTKKPVVEAKLLLQHKNRADMTQSLTTNEEGKFSFHLPSNQQLDDYELYIYATKYKTLSIKTALAKTIVHPILLHKEDINTQKTRGMMYIKRN